MRSTGFLGAVHRGFALLGLFALPLALGACAHTPVPPAEDEAIQYRCYGYLYGREGLAEDFEAAREWCRRSALLENNSGQTLYAEILYLGLGAPVDYEEAAKWYLRAALNGHSHAQLMLGRLYLRGHGVEVDRAEAAYWLTLSAEAGNEAALDELSTLVADLP